MTDSSIFTIGSKIEDVNTEQIVAEIQQRVQQNMENGLYQTPEIIEAEKHRLINVKKPEEFSSYFMSCLKSAITVDINDFKITEKRSFLFSFILVKFKTLIWKCLKFYTYRMWTQQNYINTLQLSALETLDQSYKEKIDALEKRIEILEKQLEEK